MDALVRSNYSIQRLRTFLEVLRIRVPEPHNGPVILPNPKQDDQKGLTTVLNNNRRIKVEYLD